MSHVHHIALAWMSGPSFPSGSVSCMVLIEAGKVLAMIFMLGISVLSVTLKLGSAGSVFWHTQHVRVMHFGSATFSS